MPKPTKFKKPPTEFYRWMTAHPEWSDQKLAEAIQEIDPEGGVSLRTVRRIRYGERSDSKSICLLMFVTGLAFRDFISTAFLRAVGERQ